MELVNLTGCFIITSDDRGNVTQVIKPGDHIAVLEGEEEILQTREGHTIRRLHTRGITGLPPPRAGVLYIVTNQVARATDRPDVVTPEFYEAYRIGDKYVGVQRFLSIIEKEDTLDTV